MTGDISSLTFAYMTYVCHGVDKVNLQGRRLSNTGDC